MKHTLSVVIITRNRSATLIENLAHLHTRPRLFHEFIVVDNASTDDTTTAVRARFPDVQIVELARNQGIMAPRNRGAERARGDLIYFLDDDGKVDLEALPTMLACFDDDPEVAVVGGRVINLPAVDVFALDFGDYRPSAPRFRQSSRFRGGHVVVRKEDFLKVGMLAEAFFYGSEERDLGFRLWKHGKKVMIYDGCVLLHRKDVTQEGNRRFYQWHYRSRLFMIWRNLPLGKALANTLLNLGAGFFASLRTGNVRAYMVGVGDGMANLPHVLTRERDPLTTAQYRALQRACGDDLRASNRWT